MNAHGEPQPTTAIDEENPNEDAIQHQQNDSDASQLAVYAYEEDAMDEEEPLSPYEEDARDYTAETTTAQMLALPSVCTFQELQQMRPVTGMGGKVAAAKQRELRQGCLENEIFEIDVTDAWPERRAVLRAVPPNLQQLIIW